MKPEGNSVDVMTEDQVASRKPSRAAVATVRIVRSVPPSTVSRRIARKKCRRLVLAAPRWTRSCGWAWADGRLDLLGDGRVSTLKTSVSCMDLSCDGSVGGASLDYMHPERSPYRINSVTALELPSLHRDPLSRFGVSSHSYRVSFHGFVARTPCRQARIRRFP